MLEISDTATLKYKINNAVETYSTDKCKVHLDILLINYRYDSEIPSLEIIINLSVNVTEGLDIFTSSVRLCYIKRSGELKLTENVHISKCVVNQCKTTL